MDQLKIYIYTIGYFKCLDYYACMIFYITYSHVGIYRVKPKVTARTRPILNSVYYICPSDLNAGVYIRFKRRPSCNVFCPCRIRSGSSRWSKGHGSSGSVPRKPDDSFEWSPNLADALADGVSFLVQRRNSMKAANRARVKRGQGGLQMQFGNYE